MGNSYNSKKPCSVWLVKDNYNSNSGDCITDILDGEGILVTGTRQVKVISLLPPRDGRIGGVKRKDDPNNIVSIDPETGEIFVPSSGINFPITIEQGGTGQTNREDALLALLPDISGQEGKLLGVYKKEDGTLGVSWVDRPSDNSYNNGDGIDISEVDPETGMRTISIKANASEFRYNDNGVMELSDRVTNALEKAQSSVQTVNQTPPDAQGNVDVAGSLPVLTLVSDFVGEISVLRDWLLTQPNQRSILYIKTQKLPDIQISVSANGFTQTWDMLANYIKTQVRALYDGCPNFTCIYNTDGELELSTNDILNPIEMYIPTVPDNESLNVQMKLVPPGAVIVSQPYATIDQVNVIVNDAVTPLQQDIKLLNLDMLFADYYIGISINYLLSGKWNGDAVSTYNAILDQLNDTNTLTFTLSNGISQDDYPLTITKQQFIDFANLDTFNNYISDQMTAQYDLTGFRVIFKELGTQGFLITNLDSDTGVLVCEQDDNNLAVLMKLTDLTGAKDRIYTEFSDNSLQAQITNNQLIIDDVFVNKIKNGENVTIDVDPATNTAIFNAIGSSGGANKVTVTVNGQNPVAYNVDDTGNITINVPLTNSLKSNFLLITTDSGKTNLQADVNDQFIINNSTKQLSLSPTTTASLAKADSALQEITVDKLQGLDISTKTANKQNITINNATKTSKGVVQIGNNIDVNNGVISTTGSGQQVVFDETMTVKQIATPLTSAYKNPDGTPATNYNYGQNWKADIKFVSPFCDYGIFYVTRLNVAPNGNTSGGVYGIYASYNKNSYNDLVSGLGLTRDAIYNALNANSGLTIAVVGKTQPIGVSTPKSAFAGANDMNAVAAVLQTQMRKSSFIPNATCIWNGSSLVFSSGTLDWNFDLSADWGGDCSNSIFLIVPQNTNNAGLIEPGGATLIPNSFGDMLAMVTFAAHDGSNNIAKIATAYNPNGNKTQFNIEIYENGYFLPEVGVYAQLTYKLESNNIYGVNQNETFNNRRIGRWDNSNITQIVATEIDPVIALIRINNKKPSPYRTLYITAIGPATGTLGDTTMMFALSLDYGCTNPIGQPIRVSQGGGTGYYEDDYISFMLTWRFPNKPSPYKNYLGNSPAFTIINNPISNKNANKLVQAGKLNAVIDPDKLAKYPDDPQLLTFTTTGLVNRGISAQIISKLSSQIYDNNHFIIPCANMTLELSKSVIDSGGDFTEYFRMDLVNYTQTFKTKVMIVFPAGKSYSNCRFKMVMGQNMMLNGIAKSGIIDLTVPATINGGQTLFFDFEITYDNQNYMNINCSQSVLPTLSIAQEVGSYDGKNQGQSDFSLGMDSYISNFTLMPQLGKVHGVKGKLQTINGKKYYTITLQPGKIYNLILGGVVATTAYVNHVIDPVYVGLVNLEQIHPSAWETYWLPLQLSPDPSSSLYIAEINPDEISLKIDMTNKDGQPIVEAKTFRLFFGTVNNLPGIRGIITDYLSINFKDES